MHSIHNYVNMKIVSAEIHTNACLFFRYPSRSNIKIVWNDIRTPEKHTVALEAAIPASNYTEIGRSITGCR